ncbi:putative AAA domain-containing protein [Tolypocladium ophioglossoides CBS 100239]|uniref:Peroxisomal ATPase PEX1 n=1 Tax=Tolypocladium ophioglossoides (strain CBS 100239) TaxID=1163406 RepID=A0A0L0NKK3_TOLOC|nr:putative AAA domain-containing protein [Tolypocladium ophioglossoides CBS 100239]
MSPSDTSKPRIGFRSSLERDVYHIIKKLEAANDDRPFKTVPAIYDAIKRSNSSLSRQKKRPLEDAIDRVLQVRRQEQDESDDSEAAIDEPEPPKPGDERFLLNRQMTKLWNTDTGSRSASEMPATKKRRIQADGDDKDDRTSGPETAVNGPIGADTLAPAKQDKSRPKKTQKPSRFQVENPEQEVPLAGLGDIYREILEDTWGLLRGSDLFESRKVSLSSGILLSGPSGTGKKSLVRNVAAKIGVPLVSLADCLRDPERIGKSLSEAVDTALSLAPSVIFIERIDRVMSRHGSPSHNEHHAKAVSEFAKQMERIRRSSRTDGHVLAMATTSRITDVDPAVLAFGLFDECIQMRMPDCAARHDILKVVTRRMKLSEDVDLVELANMTHGYVGTDLAAITTLAGKRLVRRAARLNNPVDTMLDLHTRLLDGQSTDMSDPDASFFTKNITNPQTADSITMEDFKAALKGFTPSLRKEGFTVIPSVTWKQVGALDEARKQLQSSIVGPIKNPDLYREFGLTRPAGVLLWGPPGCGKTLVAQAVANEAQASFILINGPELLNKYVGESERAVRELFQRARSSTPCILFFDEIDSIVPPRSNSSTESGARVVNALLTELDGAQDRTGIYVIGTTNRPEMIDEAMLRPGRLSVQLLVDLPTPRERVDILRTIYRTNHEKAPEDVLEKLAVVALDTRCSNFSGADLSGLHTKAAQRALDRCTANVGEARVITAADWEFALDNTRASVRDPASYRLRGS